MSWNEILRKNVFKKKIKKWMLNFLKIKNKLLFYRWILLKIKLDSSTYVQSKFIIKFYNKTSFHQMQF